MPNKSVDPSLTPEMWCQILKMPVFPSCHNSKMSILTFDLKSELGPAVPCSRQGEGGTVNGVGGKCKLFHALPTAPAASRHGSVCGLSAVEVLDAARPLSPGTARHRHSLQQVIHG